MKKIQRNNGNKNRMLAAAGLRAMRFKIFVAIARHPGGISVPDVAANLKVSIPLGLYHVNKLEKDILIQTTYEKRNGSVERFCFVTPFGLHAIIDEFQSLLTLFTEIEKDLIAAQPNK